VRPRPFKACVQKSGEIRELLQRYSPIVEGASIDEWYLDMTGTEGVYHHEPLAATAERIRAGFAKRRDSRSRSAAARTS